MEIYNAKDTFTYDPHSKQGLHEIAMTSRLLEKSLGESKVREYHLIFYLNGVLIATGEGPTKFRPVILRLGLKKFLSNGATKFNVYIWSFIMKRKFSKHLEIVKERIDVHFKSSRIVDQALCLKNEHLFPEKP
jgi:hypothetical protein